MDILDDMGVSKLSAKVFLKVNCSFKETQTHLQHVFSETQTPKRTSPSILQCLISYVSLSCWTKTYNLLITLYLTP